MPATLSRTGLTRLITSATLIALMVPTVAAAQDKDGKREASTADLNRQQAAASAAQNDANRAGSEAFVHNVADYEAQRTAAAQARAAYEAEMAAHREAQAAYDAAYARWQADVIACNNGNGDRTRCGAVAPAPK